MIVLVKHYFRSIIINAQLLLGILFIGCANDRNQFTIEGNTMGTTYSIKFVTSSNEIDVDLIEEGIDSILWQVNKQMSTWDPESEISKFNSWKSEKPYSVSEPLINVIGHSMDISRKTNGLFDITVYELMRLWGFGPNPKYEMPKNDEIKSVLNKTGYEKITINNGTLIKSQKDIKLDLNAIGKGYGVDFVFDYVVGKGLDDVFVEIGGEVRCSGKNRKNRNWTIGIEDPLVNGTDNNGLCAILHLDGGAVATSGNYRNIVDLDGEVLGHTISPETGFPIQNDVLSVTVLSESCMIADAWATALMVMNYKTGYEMVENDPEIDAIWIIKDERNRRYVSMSGQIDIRELIYPFK